MLDSGLKDELGDERCTQSLPVVALVLCVLKKRQPCRALRKDSTHKRAWAILPDWILCLCFKCDAPVSQGQSVH